MGETLLSWQGGVFSPIHSIYYGHEQTHVSSLDEQNNGEVEAIIVNPHERNLFHKATLSDAGSSARFG